MLAFFLFFPSFFCFFFFFHWAELLIRRTLARPSAKSSSQRPPRSVDGIHGIIVICSLISRARRRQGELSRPRTGDMRGVSSSGSGLPMARTPVRRASEGNGMRVVGLCNLLDVTLVDPLLVYCSMYITSRTLIRDEIAGPSIRRFYFVLSPEACCLFLPFHPLSAAFSKCC